MRSTCLFVTIDGLDGVGKTSTALHVARELTKLNLRVVVRHYEKTYLRSAFRHARERNNPQLKYILQTAALILVGDEVARAPEDTIFICDRYYFSARAYYIATTRRRDLLRGMAEFLRRPEVPILLECSAATRRQRLVGRKNKASKRKLDTTDQLFSRTLHRLLIRSAAWYRINNERLTLRETTALVCKTIMKHYYGQR